MRISGSTALIVVKKMDKNSKADLIKKLAVISEGLSLLMKREATRPSSLKSTKGNIS